VDFVTAKPVSRTEPADLGLHLVLQRLQPCESRAAPPAHGRSDGVVPGRPDHSPGGSCAQQVMLKFRVRDLDAMLAQLRAKGPDVAKETQDMEGVGLFGWVTDPDGNRVELWQPTEQS
jgi:predicted enzyme related to lactoylglutathione lyase